MEGWREGERGEVEGGSILNNTKAFIEAFDSCVAREAEHSDELHILLLPEMNSFGRQMVLNTRFFS